ncbi:MAG: GAF domain-containing SpoIIE family protein phosphatase [Verrucomicrobiota bacterium]
MLILLLLLIGAGVSLRQQQILLKRLRQSRDRLQAGEEKAFQFFHNLGAELQRNDSAANMHRFIVEGLVETLEADGGGLFLLDARQEELVPGFLSNRCPPLAELPERFASPNQQAERVNYERLRVLRADHPLYGEVWKQRRRLLIHDLAQEERFAGLGGSLHEGVQLLLAPLVYAERPLGVLVAAQQGEGKAFTNNQRDVFYSLAEQSSFAMGTAILQREVRDKRLLESEIRMASEFQRILMPSAPPASETFAIAGVNYPAKMVSGDYYDYLSVADNHLGVAIADVSGKGIPASLIMATCRSVLRARARDDLSPSEVLRVVNRQIFPDIREDMFITVGYLIFSESSDEVLMARAGHDPPLLLRADSDEVEAVDAPGMAVGIDGGNVFSRVIEDHTFAFRAGDLLLCYTDGVTEAMNAEGDEFGIKRLEESLQKHRQQAPEILVEGICRDVRKFRGEADQSDDITLIAIQKRPMVGV